MRARLFHCRRRINVSQIGGNFLALLLAYKVQAVAYQMHDAKLHLNIRVHGFDSLRKPLEPIYAGNQNVFDATVL